MSDHNEIGMHDSVAYASDTPRTDALSVLAQPMTEGEPVQEMVRIKDARELERESAAKDARIRELEGQLEGGKIAYVSMVNLLEKMTQRAESAEQRLEKVQKDAERLDAIQNRKVALVENWDGTWAARKAADDGFKVSSWHLSFSIREAIDKARA